MQSHSSCSIGDDFGRSVSYGLWSLLVPVGYNRDPASPMGYSNIKIVPAGLSAVDAENRLRGENQGEKESSGMNDTINYSTVNYNIISLNHICLYFHGTSGSQNFI